MIFLFLGGDFNCTENYVLDRNHLEPHSVVKVTVCTLWTGNNVREGSNAVLRTCIYVFLCIFINVRRLNV